MICGICRRDVPDYIAHLDEHYEDCPGCGGDGSVYSQNKPYPDGPCLRCGGSWLKGHRWTSGTGRVPRRAA